MKLTPQTYRQSSLHDALADGCDIVQPKIAGQWVRVVVSRGLGRVYSQEGDQLFTFDTHQKACCMLIGDLIGPPRYHTTPYIVVWDCWSICQEDPESVRLEDTNLEGFTYRNRFSFLKLQARLIGPPLQVIQNFPIGQAEKLWSEIPPRCCGLVYRRSTDVVKSELRVMRWYENMPQGL